MKIVVDDKIPYIREKLALLTSDVVMNNCFLAVRFSLLLLPR